MPVLKHAKKKLRQDKVRTTRNKKQRAQYKDVVKAARKNATATTVSAAFKAVDKAAKNNIIHKNKAARMKASLAKTLDSDKKPAAPKAEKKEAAKPAVKKNTNSAKKPAAKKSSAKK